MDDIRYQAFISYAWDNNLSSSLPGPDGSRRGWVQVFHDELNRELVANLSRMLRQGRRDGLLWIDYEQLRGGEPLTPAIRAKLAASRLFVPILSRAWFESDWCLAELERFLAAHPDGPTRLFPIWHGRVDEDDLTDPRALAAHRQLRRVHGLNFWFLDDEGQVRTLWDPVQDATERRYLRLQQDLARRMAERIAAIAAAEGDASAVAPAPDSLEHPLAAGPGQPNGNDQAPAPAPDQSESESEPEPEPIPGRHLVLINGGINDAAHILALAEHLRKRHRLGTAVPLQTQPTLAKGKKPSTLRRDLRAKLDSCTAVLFFYRAGPPDRLDEQIDLCSRAATEPRDDGSTLTLDLCQCGDLPLLLVPQELRVHESGDHRDCCERFVAALRERVAR